MSRPLQPRSLQQAAIRTWFLFLIAHHQSLRLGASGPVSRSTPYAALPFWRLPIGSAAAMLSGRVARFGQPFAWRHEKGGLEQARNRDNAGTKAPPEARPNPGGQDETTEPAV